MSALTAEAFEPLTEKERARGDGGQRDGTPSKVPIVPVPDDAPPRYVSDSGFAACRLCCAACWAIACETTSCCGRSALRLSVSRWSRATM